ncbi:MAG: S1C family serine protease [Akkermansiaceae bacterium]|jgi:serine protease Do|nr:S1C family serine protease [Luteolibacter sp.]
MKGAFIYSSALWVIATLGFVPMAAHAFPLNEKKAPETQEDLMLIQQTLLASIPKAKAATVSIDLGNGFGSGVIVSKEGLVMTAAHVSGGVGKKVTIIMPDGTKHKANTLGLMAETDAALVQITDTGEYPFVELNRTGNINLGDWVFSLGHSGGFNKERGAVARLARLVRVANTTYQTDGTLIGGDSGGPLFDLDGKLIGIHSRVGPQLPVNMHVPVQVFIDNWEPMMKSEFMGEGPFAQKPIKGNGMLGVATKSVEAGLEITKVGKKTAAEKAELKVGDVIRKVDGKEVKTREELQTIIKDKSAGEELELEILRDGKERKITAELAER